MATLDDNVIQGLDELRTNFQRVGEAAQGKTFRSSVRRGALVLRDRARANASQIDDPESPEKIADNIVAAYSGRELRRSGNLRFRVGVLGGAKKYADTTGNRRRRRVGQTYKTSGSKDNPGGDTWYWRFVELGVPSRGIPARPFLRKAAEGSEEAVVAEISRTAFKSLTRQIKRQRLAKVR